MTQTHKLDKSDHASWNKETRSIEYFRLAHTLFFSVQFEKNPFWAPLKLSKIDGASYADKFKQTTPECTDFFAHFWSEMISTYTSVIDIFHWAPLKFFICQWHISLYTSEIDYYGHSELFSK